MELKFRDLRADEVEVRVSIINDKGCKVLLYKDARCDRDILDGTVGPMNWKKSYQLIDGQLFCTIEIWDTDKKQWIGKQDVGVESNTEEVKGRASDAQKRAAFCWGIGRELYSVSSIWINATSIDMRKNDKGKWQVYSTFKVSEMTVVNKRIVSLEIIAKSRGRDWEVVYSMGNKKPVPGEMVGYCISKSPFDGEPATMNESELKYLLGIMENVVKVSEMPPEERKKRKNKEI